MCVLTRISAQGWCMGLHGPGGTGSAPLVTSATQRVSKRGRQRSQEEAGLCKHTSPLTCCWRWAGTSGHRLFRQGHPRPRSVSHSDSCAVSPRMESLQTPWATRSSALQCSHRPFCVLLSLFPLLLPLGTTAKSLALSPLRSVISIH